MEYLEDDAFLKERLEKVGSGMHDTVDFRSPDIWRRYNAFCKTLDQT